MAKLTFDEEKHEYRLDGRKLISVTTVLREARIFDYSSFVSYAAEKGTAIHTLTELHDQGALDEERIVNPLVPYLDVWKKFRSDTNVEILGTEELVYNPIYLYAGKLDRRVRWRGKEAIIDLKTGAKAPWHALQTAAYAKCFNGPMLRFCLYLRQNGTYEFDEHKDPDDWDVFRSALAIVNWKRKIGMVRV